LDNQKCELVHFVLYGNKSPISGLPVLQGGQQAVPVCLKAERLGVAFGGASMARNAPDCRSKGRIAQIQIRLSLAAAGFLQSAQVQ